ncbi:MAG: CAP domain-containing protein [Elainellaceae cyanobacterium]
MTWLRSLSVLLMGLGGGLTAVSTGAIASSFAAASFAIEAQHLAQQVESPADADQDDAEADSPESLADEVAEQSGDCREQDILTAPSCSGDDLSEEETQLYQLITNYREEAGLAAIPLSPALTQLANRHVLDLEHNLEQGIDAITHGWSDCPYSFEDQESWPCMWEAPQRLNTGYPGQGYENLFGAPGDYQASATAAFESWSNSDGHKAVMLNQGAWVSREWNAIGVGIYGGYVVLWFGEEADPTTVEAVSPSSSEAPESL